MKTQNKTGYAGDFDAITLRVASPERIREWSCGEVTKPETINYRTQRSEKAGLFDEKIFGPERDYECYCSKYRGIRYRGIVCEKCGVEITRSIVRRERMGHIELASPVSHIWFLRSMPSRVALILGVPSGDLEKVIYFAGYIVTKVFEDERRRLLRDLDSEFKAKIKTIQDEKTKEAFKQALSGAKAEIESVQEGVVFDEVHFHSYSMKYGSLFEAGIGAEAIFKILRGVDMVKLEEALSGQLLKAGNLDKEKLNKRLSLLRAMIKSGTKPEWMFLTTIPVIPPALRPMVPLDGGRYATSDVNDLYRRVINRNNRLKKLMEIMAPEVILRNEKRILQEAVDSLIDNSIRHGSASQAMSLQAQRRQLKSMSDNLKGKRGLFRANLLGKRVDYSGRSVIVVGPDLKLNECGLPKHMALELFRPFVISKLLERELAYNIRGAGRLIEDDVPEVWAILEEIIKGRYVLLNRAPTLHRLGIQAFKPVLIEGNAIQVHPLVCTAFNADFDGDQMAVHVPLSEEAQLEAREIMASDKNILKPGSGDPIINAKMLDIILGVFWVTKVNTTEAGVGRVFEDPKAVLLGLDFKTIGIRAPIKVLVPKTAKFGELGGTLLETTAGRLLFNEILPEDYPFINKEIDRKMMAGIIDDLSSRYGISSLPAIMDQVKLFGFHYATVSGTTWGIDDVVIPKGKKVIIDDAKKQADLVIGQYNEGLFSSKERHAKIIEIWHKVKGEIEKLIPDSLDKNGSVYDLSKSGARGSISQITQMAGIKGLIVNTQGQTIEFPILSSMKEGLTPIEYFTTTHGSRKGLTDTALNTARAGYLTRRLFDVAQDAIVTEEDCGTKDAVVIDRVSATGIEIPLWRKIKGRILAEDLKDSDGKLLFKKEHVFTKTDALKVEQSTVSAVRVRSPLTCESKHGICMKCYGYDLGKDKLVDLGEAIGTVAAQAIGEPGTQLTMRTFHAGGTASVGGDITTGLPRVEEVFEKRKPKNPAVVSHTNGVVVEIKESGKERLLVVAPEVEDKKSKKDNIEYSLPFNRVALVKAGESVVKGQILTDGSADIDELFKYGGREAAQNYIIEEVNKLYELQGEAVSRKHIEVIVRQMFSRRRVKDAGATGFTTGEVVGASDLEDANEKAREAGLPEAKGEPLVMGITEVSLSRTSFLSAASFQHTTRVLIAAAVRGTVDRLKGLKENVIIGRLIPAGTGFPGSPKHRMIAELQAASTAREQAEESAELETREPISEIPDA